MNAVGSMGDAIQAIAMNGHVSITTLLIPSKASMHNYCGYYGSPLHAAAFRGHVDVVRVLLDSGVSVQSGGWYGDTIHGAVERGKEDVAGLLLTRADFQQVIFNTVYMASEFDGAQDKNLLEATPAASLSPGNVKPCSRNLLATAPLSSLKEVLNNENLSIASESQISLSSLAHQRLSYDDKHRSFHVAIANGNRALVTKILGYGKSFTLDAIS